MSDHDRHKPKCRPRCRFSDLLLFSSLENKISESFPHPIQPLPVASLMKMSLCSSCEWVMPRTYHMGVTSARAQGFGILPTPDPTIARCISDGDIASSVTALTNMLFSNFTYTSLITTSDPRPTHTCSTSGPLYAADNIFIHFHTLKHPVHPSRMFTPNLLLHQ